MPRSPTSSVISPQTTSPCINTDNPYLIHTNLKQEYEIIGGDLGGDASELLDLSKIHAREHRFLNE